MQVQAPEHLNNVEHATMAMTMIFSSVPHELQDQGQEELHQGDVPERVVEEDLQQKPQPPNATAVTART